MKRIFFPQTKINVFMSPEPNAKIFIANVKKSIFSPDRQANTFYSRFKKNIFHAVKEIK